MDESQRQARERLRSVSPERRLAIPVLALALLMGFLTTVAIAWWSVIVQPGALGEVVDWSTSDDDRDLLAALRESQLMVRRVSSANEDGKWIRLSYEPPRWSALNVPPADRLAVIVEEARGFPAPVLRAVWRGELSEGGDEHKRLGVADLHLSGGIPVRVSLQNSMGLYAALAVRALPVIPIWPAIVWQPLMYGLIWWIVIRPLFWPVARRLKRLGMNLCVECRYDLRGAAHGRCPECGVDLKTTPRLWSRGSRGVAGVILFLGVAAVAGAVVYVVWGNTQPMGIHEAAAFGSTQDIMKAIANGADINGIHTFGTLATARTQATALQLAADRGEWDMAMALLDAGADPNLGDWPPLLTAVRFGTIEHVRRMLAAGADPNKRENQHFTIFESGIFFGADLEAIRVMVDAGANVNALTSQEFPPLIAALGAPGEPADKRERIALFLLERGADFRPGTTGNFSALGYAARAGLFNIVRRFIEVEGIEVNTVDGSGQTPLYEACEHWHEDVVRYLIERGADVNRAANDGSTPLMEATAQVGIMRLLIDAGADVNAIEKDGLDALGRAAPYAETDVIRVLLEAGANPYRKYHDGQSILDLLMDESSRSVVSEWMATHPAVPTDSSFAVPETQPEGEDR